MNLSFKLLSIFIITVLTVFNSLGQHKYSLSGIVNDEDGEPLPGCHVHYNGSCAITDLDGTFFIPEYKKDTIHLYLSFIGLAPQDTIIDLSKTSKIKLTMMQDLHSLNQVNVNANRIDTFKTRKNEIISTDFITQNLSGTFVKSIEKIPGVNSMDIGANASKPIVRGMGFSRVVVSENGIKQEGQQWGADHGLELDPFSVEMAEIVKGASAIEHGSEAIGGYINVSNDKIPAKNSLQGNVNLIGKSVNETLGGSFFINGRLDKLFFKFRSTMLDFGDYNIPTDTIVYLTRRMPVENSRLKNTAGKEYDFYGQIGYTSSGFQTFLSASNVSQKHGFFPGAHGVPDLGRVRDDGDSRNIDFPYQNAKHFKLLSNSRFILSNSTLFVDLAYQDNHRQEWSAFHTHYPGQIAPEENTNLELDFNLKTYNANVKYEMLVGNHEIGLGVQNQWKKNTIDGYNFLLPAYENYSFGLFLKNDFRFSDKLKITGALRYDFSSLNTKGFYDPILYDYFISEGESENDANFYANRSVTLDKFYNDISWLMGLVYKPIGKMTVRLNIGKAFRTPTAIELASNGIHHGSFRHELGDNNLDSEKGYYLDGNFEWHTNQFDLSLSPYLYYFSNYIYLSPSGEWSSLPHAGQIYHYQQSKAMLSGVELSFTKSFLEIFSLYTSVEYIYTKQLTDEASKRYPLPFTPPFNAFVELDYFLFKNNNRLQETKLFFNCRIAKTQDEIAQNEEITDGYTIFGVGLSFKINTKNNHLDLVLQVSNIFDTKYFNHVSFYRKVEIPEQGRNIQLLVKIPFTIKNN